MADVVIERCTLRVVRHGGWRWGAEPRRVVDAAARVLPALLATHLSELWPEGAEGEINTPVKLSLSLRLSELEGLSDTLPSQAAEQAVREALAVVVAGLRDRIQSVRRPAGAPSAHPETLAPSLQSWAATVLRLLASWHLRAQLESTLRGFSFAALDVWERAVFGPSPAPATSARGSLSIDEMALEREIQTLAALELAPDRPVERLRMRLRAAAVVFARFGATPLDVRVREAIDRRLPIVQREVTLHEADDVSTRSSVSRAPKSAARQARRRDLEPVEVQALPFLLLSPLAHVGWLETAAVTLDAQLLPALAAGLAFKVLDASERGWRRTPAALRGAAAFAGLVAVDEAAIVELAEQTTLLSALDAVLARAVLEGHAAARPFVVYRPSSDESGLLLVDAEGLFPVSWVPDDAALVRLLEGAATDPVLVTRSAASRTLLSALDAAGHRFVTTAAPTRGESWRRLEGAPGERYFTNDSTDALLGAARGIPGAEQELTDTWRALTRERPAAPRSDPALDRSLALATLVALSYLSWTLWRKREATHPRLALERFADLAAWITFRDEVVDVRLPQGSRHSDLAARGLLDDVPSVPWLGGRTVRFVGG